jgi:hypothetical protein
MPEFEYKVYPDGTDFFEASARETEEFKGKVFVGVHPDSWEGAVNLAWEVARERYKLTGPKHVRVLELSGTLDNDNRRAYVIINAG